jgi:hypothetical protein
VKGVAATTELVAWEAVTSIGEGAVETSALWEAGIVNLAPSRFVLDDGTAAALCASPALSPALLGTERLAALIGLALERLAATPEGNALRGIGTLLLCLPERMADAANGYRLRPEGQALVDALHARPLLAGRKLRIEPFPFGRAAGAPSIQRALELVASGQRVLWGGVDSQHDWQVLGALAAGDRLLTEENVDGIRPGEAASVLLLQPAQGGTQPVLMGVGLGREQPPDETRPASRADGLARAVRSATARLAEQRRRCGHWLFDTTHEKIATQRLQHVLTACADIVGLQTSLHSPLKTLGDAGAASLPLFAALAAESWRNGTADDETALLAASSDSGACGAILLAETLSRTSP